MTVTTAEDEIRALHHDWIEANKVGDTGWLRAHVAPGGPEEFVFFNHNCANYYGVDAAVELWQHLAKAARSSAAPSRLVLEDRDVRVTVRGDVAWVSYLAWFEADFGDAGKESTGSRGTEVWERQNGEWRLVHLHCSPHTPGVNLGS